MTTVTAVHHRSLGDHSWRTEAVCQPTTHSRVDPDLFFPEPDEMDKIRAATALCDQCPVRRACLDAALENGDTCGIRGGLTEHERASLHEKLAERLDHSRVNATLAGRDIHLTAAERRAVIRAAHRQGVSTQRLASLLKFTEAHAAKKYREIDLARQQRDNKRATSSPSPDEKTTTHPVLVRSTFGTAA